MLASGDTAVEPNDTFTLTVTAAGLNTVTSTGTISNDDVAAPTTPTLVFASPNNQQFNASDSNSTRSRRVDRWPHYLPKEFSEIEFSWHTWRMISDCQGELTDITNPITTLSAVAECNGVAVQLLFDGQATKVINPTDNDIRPQKLLPSMFGLTTFAPGTTIWTKTVSDLGANGNINPTSPRNTADTSGSQSAFFDPAATTITNPLGTGAFAVTGTALQSRVIGWHPWVLGKPVGSFKVWLARGDSVTSTGDNTGSRDGRGWYQRACSTMGVPCANLATHGSKMRAGTTDARLAHWYQFATHGVVFYGTYDIGSTANGTAADADKLRTDAITR